MKILIILLLTWIMMACTHTIYGVSEQRWQEMSEMERQNVIEHFKQQEELFEKTREQADAARQEAKKFERLCREEPEKCEKIKRQRIGF